jgi:glycosyltransferase involved in cell wall biosynthesis
MLHQSKGIKHSIFKLFWFTIPIRKVEYVTAISIFTKGDVIHFTGCNPAKIEIVYVPLDPRFVAKLTGFNAERPRILQIGTALNKNLKRLIPALSTVTCKLVIIGKINDEELHLLKEHRIDFELLDRKLSDQEILHEYKKCDIVSFVSTLEGFGMPIVEANAIGRVVITGNITSMPEIAGDAAHLVDPYRIEDITAGFRKVITDSSYRDRLINNGFENIKRFNPKTIATDFAGVYSKIV